MSLADFQNPIANSPHVTQSNSAQHNIANNINQNFGQEQLRTDEAQANAVDETEESAEKDAIREDEEQGERQNAQARRRARPPEPEPEEELPPIDDGIHGGVIDLKA